MPVSFKFENSNLIVIVDSNKDGEPLLTLTVNLAEIPDEVLALITAKKA
jgi:hypothetical protein